MKNNNSIKTVSSRALLKAWLWVALGTACLLQPPARVSAQTNNLPPAPSGYSWQANPQLSDDFTAPQLDRSKWMPYHPYWQGRQPSRYEMANVVVTNGMLQLQNTTTITNLAQVIDPTNNVWIGAACLSSLHPIAAYGYYEAKIKASRLSMGSSFWLQGNYSEIDVAEPVGAPITNPNYSLIMPMNTHYFINGWGTDKASPVSYVMPSGAADEFHTYGVWWKDPNNIWFYHNGTNVAKVVTTGQFNEPMYLYFDTEAFPWMGLPGVSSLQQAQTNAMSVDWVHAWQLVPNSTTN